MSSEIEWDDNSPWPARLLHVESLTSYPWQPGDVYGGVTRPRYNAISYTWGRFQLSGDQQPEIKAIPVRGTTWEEYLPRIQPERFTVDDMLLAIRTVAAPHAGYPAVDFIWLDVACIDQTPDSPEMAREIGRQAKIFRGAADVFVWLTTLRSKVILDWAYEMERLVSELFTIDKPHTPSAVVSSWMVKAADLFQRFTSDDWFSSLWTLQEAFLGPKSIFLFRDGLPLDFINYAYRDGGGNIQLHRLDSWAQTWYSIMSLARSLLQYPEAEKLRDDIDRIGFLDGIRNQWLTFALDDLDYPSGFAGNPFRLLVASKHRTTRNEVDRVYGIMQVFELRLGKAAPGASGDRFSVEELRAQLAAAVLSKYPVLSQLVIQHEDCKPNEAWMISPSLDLPQEAYRAWSHLAFGGEVVCKTSMKAEQFQGTLWARFSGPVSLFSSWCKKMEMHVDNISTRLLLDLRWEREMAHDAVNSTVNMSAGLQWLQSRFNRVTVVLLGCLAPPKGMDFDRNSNDIRDWRIGLLLVPVGEMVPACYHRVGVLIWDIGWTMKTRNPLTSEVAEYINGDGNYWTPSSGLFG